jgi:oligosaccharide repeat unit polymerase
MVKGMYKKSAWQLLLGVTSFLITIIALLKIILKTHVSQTGDNWTIAIAIIALLWIGIYFISTYMHFKTPYLFASAYIICLMVFHLAITIPSAFDIFTSINWKNYGANAYWLEKAGWCTLLAFGSFGIGYAINCGIYKHPMEYSPKYQIIKNKSLDIAFWDSVGLFVASVMFLLLAFKSFGNILNYSRADLFRGVGGDTRGFGVFMMIFPSSAILMVIGARSANRIKMAGIVAFIAFSLFYISGYRSAALFPLLVGVIVWVKTGHKLPKFYAIGAIVFVLMTIPVIGQLRMAGDYGDWGKKDVRNAIDRYSFEENFRVTGQTGGLLASVLRLVPNVDDYRYGETYLIALQRSIPNILPKMGKNARLEASRKALFEPDAISKMVPSDWLTYRVAKDKFKIGQGVGFTAIGEPYLNFGYGGVIIFFLLLGSLLARLDIKNLLLSPNLLVFSSAMVWPLIRTVRNDFSNFIKPTIFTGLILLLWRLIAKYCLDIRCYK